MEKRALLFTIPIIGTVSAVLNGFVLTKLWGWFIVPVFKAPELSLVPAIGLGIIVSFFTTSYKENSKPLEEILLTATLVAIFKPALFLLLGWVVHLFM